MGAEAVRGEVTGDLGWLLGASAQGYFSHVEQVVAAIPHGMRGYYVLKAVQSQCPGSQLELGRRLLIDKTVMTHVLDDLESAGLLERQPDPSDRRARRVVLTKAGGELVADSSRRLADQEKAMLAPLADEQRAALVEALTLLAGHAGLGPGCGELASPAAVNACRGGL